MDLQIAGKSAVITGAAQGIGRAIAECFLQEGAHVSLLDINPERLTKTVAELSSTYSATDSADINHYECDVTNESAVEQTLKTINQRHGINFLINNAGVSDPAPIEKTTLASWQQVNAVNLNAPFITSKHCFGYMKQQKGGVILNIASFAGKRGTLFGNNISYASSKAGIIGLTKALVPEAATVGIRVVAVCPGIVETDMLKKHSAEARHNLAQLVPLRRLAQPHEIAKTVVYLCSPCAAYIMGEVLDINGGLYLD